MKVTEHYGNFSPDWSEDEVNELMRLVKNEMGNYPDDKATQMYYAKMYGKLLGMKHDLK